MVARSFSLCANFKAISAIHLRAPPSTCVLVVVVAFLSPAFIYTNKATLSVDNIIIGRHNGAQTTTLSPGQWLCERYMALLNSESGVLWAGCWCVLNGSFFLDGWYVVGVSPGRRRWMENMLFLSRCMSHNLFAFSICHSTRPASHEHFIK